MLCLFSTHTYTDWKGRPNASLSYEGTGTREELIDVMNSDVEKWQKEEIAEDREEYEHEKAAGEDLDEPSDEWEIENERWEMKYSENPESKTLREFVWDHDGEFSSVIYHILDLPFVAP